MFINHDKRKRLKIDKHTLLCCKSRWRLWTVPFLKHLLQTTISKLCCFWIVKSSLPVTWKSMLKPELQHTNLKTISQTASYQNLTDVATHKLALKGLLVINNTPYPSSNFSHWLWSKSESVMLPNNAGSLIQPMDQKFN